MRKTLREMLHEKHPKTFNTLFAYQIIDLMQYVREQTLKECAERLTEKFMAGHVDYEMAKDSILSLNKNTIEI